MDPEIRNEIVDAGSNIYIGLSYCQAYDRVWVRQCYQCQGHSLNTDK